MGEPLAFFSLFFDDLVIEGIDAPKCLRANLVQNEYRGGRLRRFTLLGALIAGDEKRYEGHIVIERVGEGIFLWGGLLVRVV